MLGKMKLQEGPYVIMVPENFGLLVLEAFVDFDANGPGVGDLNSTTYTDYMVKIMDQNAPIKTYIVQTATTSVLNRCIPEDGGENLKIGNDLIVLADLLNGWKTILVSGSIALICGFTWLMLITRFPRIVVTCTVFGTFMTALGIVAGLVLIAYPSTR